MGIVSTPAGSSSATFVAKTVLIFVLGIFTLAAHRRGARATADAEAPSELLSIGDRIVLPAPFEKVAPPGAKSSASVGLMATGECEHIVPDVRKYVGALQLGKSHTAGQFLGAQALMEAKSIQNLSKGFLPFLHHHSMIKHLFASKIGLYHASVWMITGVADPSWELVASHLCPRPEYEFVQMCLHGFGHSGFVRLQHNTYPDGYSACSYQQTVYHEHLVDAYEPCSRAPSTFLEYLCSHGFYHGVWEHMDTTLTPYMYPCVDEPGKPSFAFKHVCFTYVFMVTAQSRSDAGPATVMQDRRELVIKNGVDGYLCPNMAKQDDLHCLFALAGQYNFNGYSTIFEEKAIAEWGLSPSTTWYDYYPFEDGYMKVDSVTMWGDIKNVCLKLTAGPLDDWDRWRACILGSTSYWVSHMFRHRSMSLPERERGCVVFLNMTGTSVDERTNFLCMRAVRLGYLSYPMSRDAESDEYGIFHATDGTGPSWATWWNASIHDESHKYYMSPWGLH